MKESPQEYTKRILGYLEGRDLFAVQARTAKRLDALIKDLPARTLRRRPAPEKWSVREILAHLVDSEIARGWRLRLILGAPGTRVQAFDQDTWVTAGHYERRNPRESLAVFRVLREANLALLKSLTPDQWKLHGLHEERGKVTIEHLARMSAGHDINHTRQVERIVGAKRKS